MHGSFFTTFKISNVIVIIFVTYLLCYDIHDDHLHLKPKVRLYMCNLYI